MSFSISIHDRATSEAMKSVTGQTVIFDESGRMLGFFTPRIVSEQVLAEHDMTEEEIEQMLNDPKTAWNSAEEVMDRLRSLRKDA